MATVIPTVTEQVGAQDKSMLKVTWAAMANGDTGSPIQFPEWSDRSVQVLGTFGAAGNARIEGSDDGGTTYAALSDRQGVALNVAAASLKAVNELPERTRPNITAGDGTTALTVVMTLRRPQHLRS